MLILKSNTFIINNSDKTEKYWAGSQLVHSLDRSQNADDVPLVF